MTTVWREWRWGAPTLNLWGGESARKLSEAALEATRKAGGRPMRMSTFEPRGTMGNAEHARFHAELAKEGGAAAARAGLTHDTPAQIVHDALMDKDDHEGLRDLHHAIGHNHAQAARYHDKAASLHLGKLTGWRVTTASQHPHARAHETHRVAAVAHRREAEEHHAEADKYNRDERGRFAPK